MKILITSHYFFPENFQINDIALKLSKLGHEITIATSKPNYPNGKIYVGYKKFLPSKEIYKDLQILRIPIIPRGKNKFFLFLNYLSHIIFGLIFLPILTRKKKFDIIFHYGAGPITSSIPSILLKYLKSSKLIIWVQDLYPDTLKSFQYIGSPIFIFLVGQIVRFIYYFSDKILVQSKGFKPAVSQYTNSLKISYFPNSILDTKKITPSNHKIHKNLIETLKEYKCFIFAGNLGEAQSLETIIKCCECLINESKFRMVLIGSGSRINWLKKQISDKRLKNLVIDGPFDSIYMPTIYELSTGLVITLNDNSHFAKTIPSKLQTYLSSGKPIVGAVDGEAKKVISESKSGLVCNSQDGVKLSKLVLEIMRKSSKEKIKMGMNGREYFKKNFDLDVNIYKLERIFKKALNTK